MSDQTFTQQFLAEWADRWKIVCVTAQNIYDLHKRAGSRNVYPAHGGYKRRKAMFHRPFRLVADFDKAVRGGAC